MASGKLPLFRNSGWARRVPLRTNNKRVQPPLERFFDCDRQNTSEQRLDANEDEDVNIVQKTKEEDDKEEKESSRRGGYHGVDPSRETVVDCNCPSERTRRFYPIGSFDHGKHTRQITCGVAGCINKKRMSSIANWPEENEEAVQSLCTSPSGEKTGQEKEVQQSAVGNGSPGLSRRGPSQKLFQSSPEMMSLCRVAVTSSPVGVTDNKDDAAMDGGDGDISRRGDGDVTGNGDSEVTRSDAGNVTRRGDGGEVVPDSEEESEQESEDPKLFVNRMSKRSTVGASSYLPAISNTLPILAESGIALQHFQPSPPVKSCSELPNSPAKQSTERGFSHVEKSYGMAKLDSRITCQSASKNLLDTTVFTTGTQKCTIKPVFPVEPVQELPDRSKFVTSPTLPPGEASASETLARSSSFDLCPDSPVGDFEPPSFSLGLDKPASGFSRPVAEAKKDKMFDGTRHQHNTSKYSTPKKFGPMRSQVCGIKEMEAPERGEPTKNLFSSTVQEPFIVDSGEFNEDELTTITHRNIRGQQFEETEPRAGIPVKQKYQSHSNKPMLYQDGKQVRLSTTLGTEQVVKNRMKNKKEEENKDSFNLRDSLRSQVVGHGGEKELLSTASHPSVGRRLPFNGSPTKECLEGIKSDQHATLNTNSKFTFSDDDSDDRELLMFNVNGSPGVRISGKKPSCGTDFGSKRDISLSTDAVTCRSAHSSFNSLSPKKSPHPTVMLTLESDEEETEMHLPRKRLKRLQRKSEAANLPSPVVLRDKPSSKEERGAPTTLSTSKQYDCGSPIPKAVGPERPGGVKEAWAPPMATGADAGDVHDEIETFSSESSEEELFAFRRTRSKTKASNLRNDQPKSSEQTPLNEPCESSFQHGSVASFSRQCEGEGGEGGSNEFDQGKNDHIHESRGRDHQPRRLSPLFKVCEERSYGRVFEEEGHRWSDPVPGNLVPANGRQSSLTMSRGKRQCMETRESSRGKPGVICGDIPTIHLDSDETETDGEPSGRTTPFSERERWDCRMDDRHPDRGKERVEELLRLRLPHFRSVAQLEKEGGGGGEPVYIDYRNQFGPGKDHRNQTAGPSSASAEREEREEQPQSKKRGRGKSKVESSKSGLTGKWIFEDGQRIYINLKGKKFFGRIAYLESLRENPKSKGKKRKPSSRGRKRA